MIEKLCKNIPEDSGVYIFKDSKGKILYIGKAVNLKKRIMSYFQRNSGDMKVALLVRKVSEIEWIITKSEVEALILENNLIKQHRPPFNIKFADDKTYPYIKIDLNERFPRLEITRRKEEKEGVLYFGPYTSSFSLKSTLNFIQKNFRLRKCTDKKFSRRTRPCLNHQIGLCMAPCCGKIDELEYREIFKEVLLFLKGEKEELLEKLYKKMTALSEELKFEEAAKIRDTIFNIEKFLENQKQSVELSNSTDTDIFYFKCEDEKIFFFVLKMKRGKVIDSEFYAFDNVAILQESPLSQFLPLYYSSLRSDLIPEKVIVQENIEDLNVLREFFKKEFGKEVEILVPDREDTHFKELLEMAKKNLCARITLERENADIKKRIKLVMGLKNEPKIIHVFDVSTFRGKSSVAVRVCFSDGEPLKSSYRRYKIKTIEENRVDDYGMMYEAVSRSLKEEVPDLIVVDGGKGQLNSALKALKDKDLMEKVDVIAIAKDEGGDKLYLPNRKNPVNLKKGDAVLKFFMRLRDEAHRFAVSYHHKRDEMEKFVSVLTLIPGVGEIRAKKLLSHFKSLENIKKAEVLELAKLPFISKKVAENIYEFMKGGGDEDRGGGKGS